MNDKFPIILSASRMTDMPAFYSEEIICETEKRIKKGFKIHTLVLWTKHPCSLFKNPLYDYLLYLKLLQIQLYIQLTISGLGGLYTNLKVNNKSLAIEPNVPEYLNSINVLPEVIRLVENPERIRVRIDPIVKLTDNHGNIFSNISMLPLIIKETSSLGIKDFVFSFLDPGMHKKVDQRIEKIGCSILITDTPERENFKLMLTNLEKQYNVRIHACSVNGFKVSKCIDGSLLSKLHDLKTPVSEKQLFKRELCGCTNSIDIGGWPPKKCFSGCIYCYSNPQNIFNI